MIVHERGLAVFHFGTEPAESLLGIMDLDRPYDGVDPLRDLAKIRPLGAHPRKAESFSALYEVVDLRGPDQCLARDAAIIEAVAAQPVLLFEDTDIVIIICHFLLLSLRRHQPLPFLSWP